MPVTSGSRVQFEFMLGGGPPPLMTYPEGYDSSVSWDKGTIMIWDSTGHVENMSSGNLSTGVFAMALSPMAATADASVSNTFLLITPQCVFSAIVAHATTASSLVQASQIHTIVHLTSSATICPSTNVRVLEVATTTTVGAYIIGNKDATGTLYGRNYFIFSKASYSSDSPYCGRAST